MIAALLAMQFWPSLTLPAMGQGYPNKPVRFIVPYPPGGGTDVMARIVQAQVSRLLGQPVLIENRSGGSGLVGTELVARAAPDGYTVLFTRSSHTINPAVFPRLGFRVEADFQAISKVASLPLVLVAHPDFPACTVAELTALAKARAGAINYASVGNGSPGHVAGELFKQRAGVDMTHISYGGSGSAVTDVMGGQVPLLWITIPAVAQQVKAGRLNALAVTTQSRSPILPDVPTMIESGFADFEVDAWYAVFAPANTPDAVVTRLHAAISQVVQEPAIRQKFIAQGAEGIGGTPEELGETVRQELPKWKQLARDASFRLE